MHEPGSKVADKVEAEMVDCAPAQEPSTDASVICQPDSPVADALHATIEQTGAGPPPDGAA